MIMDEKFSSQSFPRLFNRSNIFFFCSCVVVKHFISTSIRLTAESYFFTIFKTHFVFCFASEIICLGDTLFLQWEPALFFHNFFLSSSDLDVCCEHN